MTAKNFTRHSRMCQALSILAQELESDFKAMDRNYHNLDKHTIELLKEKTIKAHLQIQQARRILMESTNGKYGK